MNAAGDPQMQAWQERDVIVWQQHETYYYWPKAEQSKRRGVTLLDIEGTRHGPSDRGTTASKDDLNLSHQCISPHTIKWKEKILLTRISYLRASRPIILHGRTLTPYGWTLFTPMGLPLHSLALKP